MAKASESKAPHLLSDSYSADDDGWLDKFIAEEEETDRATLWRLGSWGLAAVAALTLGLASGQLPGGAIHRSDAAATELASQTQRLEGLARATGQETRRLSAAIDTLNQDRDRLFSRVTSVEQGLDSVTGAIPKPPLPPAADTIAAKPDDKAAPAAIPKEAAAAPPAPAAVAVAPREQSKDAAKPSDQPAPAAQSKPNAEAAIKKADRSDNPRPAPATTASNEAAADAAATSPPSGSAAAAGQPSANGGGTENVTTLAPTKQASISPPPSSAIVSSPLPALPEDAAAQRDAMAAEAPVERTQFGLDLGGASSMAGLRALWNGVRKSHAAQFGELRPVLAIRQNKSGLGLQVHVVAGPIADAATAAKLCALLIADERDCETAVFDGQRLVPDPANVKAKPSTPARSTRHRQTKRDEAPAAPPPKPSALSWLGVH